MGGASSASRFRGDRPRAARPAAAPRGISDAHAFYFPQFAAVADRPDPLALLDQPLAGLDAKARCKHAFYLVSDQGLILFYLEAGNALVAVIREKLDEVATLTDAQIAELIFDKELTDTGVKKVTFAFMLAAVHVAATRDFSSRYSKHKLILAKKGWEKMHDKLFKITQPNRAGPTIQIPLAIDVLFADDPRVTKGTTRPSYDFKTNGLMFYSILEELYA